MTKEIETSKGKFLVVEAIDNANIHTGIKLSEITEEQANDIVQNSFHTGLFAHYVKDTVVNVFCYTKAKDSLNTLLKSYDIEITPNTYIFKT